MGAEEAKEREGTGQNASICCSLWPKHREDELKTLCSIFLEALDKLQPRGKENYEENIFKLNLSRGGGAKIQPGRDPKGQNRKKILPLN